MKTKIEFLKYIHGLLKNPKQESLNLSMNDVHHKGLFSLVIGGTKFGNLTRVFIADNPILPYEVQMHTHRYPIRLTVIKGQVLHHVAYKAPSQTHGVSELSEFEYHSPLNGGAGLKYLRETLVNIIEHYIPIGATLVMDEKDYHTVSCSQGSIWIVEECGFKTETSKVLGVPFVTDGLYTPPKGFQINDKVQSVAKEIKRIILDYELV